MSRLIKPLAVAIAALLVAGGVGLAFAGGDGGTYRVTAYFDKTIGLFQNSDVTVLGVPVGNITRIQPEGNRVRVEMEIRDEHKVPDDAFAQIVPISIIADRYIQLEPVYTGGAALEDGAVLDVDRTQIPAELDDVFKQLKKLLDAIEPGEEGEPGALGELIVQLDEALSDREEDLRGTLVTGADLTSTLAEAKENLSGLLVNLDDLFGSLQTRAGAIGSLNRNFAVVMAALAESRADLEGTITNLAEMTNEVGDLVQTHRRTLGPDLARAGKILSAIVRNRSSLEESLSWLPVVGEALANAHHGGEVSATDVRDNMTSTKCKQLEELPEPIQDALRDLIRAFCGTDEPQSRTQDAPAAAPAPPVAPPLELDCEEGIRKVRRQIRRIARIEGIPADLKKQVLKPLRRRLNKLGDRCDELGSILEDPEKFFDDLIEELTEDLGGVPDAIKEINELGDVDLSAAGGATAPPETGGWRVRLSSWLSGMLSFVGGWAK